MKIILVLVAIIIFWFGAYYMGNAVLDTFKKPFLFEQIMSTLYGILLWLGIGVICLITFGIYYGIQQLIR